MDHVFASLRRYGDETASAIRADAVLYAAMAVYLLAGLAYVLSKSGMLFGDFEDYVEGCVVLCCVILPYGTLIVGMAHVALRLRQRRSLAYRFMFAPRRIARLIAGTLLMLLILVLFQEMFTSIKSAFSNAGFGYDALIANIDKFLHFGHAPVKYLLPLAQNRDVLRIVEFNYDEVWVTIWLGMLYWMATSPKADGIRVRYCLTFFLVWGVVGNVAAGLLPTAGPAFYGLVTGDAGRFANLQGFLDNSSSATAITQHYLWALHQKGTTGLGAGISAFPSMHVAVTAMSALFVAERGRRMAVIGALYTLVVMISSVYLGWHYAIDGYIAVILTSMIYWAVRIGMPAVDRALTRASARRAKRAPSATAFPKPIPAEPLGAPELAGD